MWLLSVQRTRVHYLMNLVVIYVVSVVFHSLKTIKIQLTFNWQNSQMSYPCKQQMCVFSLDTIRCYVFNLRIMYLSGGVELLHIKPVVWGDETSLYCSSTDWADRKIMSLLSTQGTLLQTQCWLSPKVVRDLLYCLMKQPIPNMISPF